MMAALVYILITRQKILTQIIRKQKGCFWLIDKMVKINNKNYLKGFDNIIVPVEIK